MDTPTLKRHLRQFGLSEKEVDTYLTILEHGGAKASDVADAAGVSKRYVYSVSEELEERGFVEVDDHVVPTIVRANPPGEVLARLQEDLTSMGPALEERYSAAEPTGEQFEVVKSRVTVLKRIRQHIEGADAEVVLSIPQARLDGVRDALAGAVSRGVLVVLVVSTADPDSDLDLDGVASVARVWREPMPSMVTADQASGLVAPTEMITRAASDRQAIVFTQPQLGPVIVGSFFGNYWPNATEAYHADPDALPKTYDGFRQAVLQATLHRHGGTELEATVEGRLLAGADATDADDEPVELRGRVVETRQGLVEPFSNDFPVENTLVVEADGRTYSVGGAGAFVEDVEAERVTLHAA